MLDESEFPGSEWEVRRGGEPLRFNQILMWKLKKVLETQIGSKDRNRGLRDLQSLVAHLIWQDVDPDSKDGKKIYEVDMEEVERTRVAVENAEVQGVTTEESIEVKHSEWLSALIRLMKRYNLLGDEHISG